MDKKYIVYTAIALVFAAFLIMARPPGDNKIFANTYIHGVPVGGLLPIEAEATLMEHFQQAFENQRIQYKLDGEVVAEFSFASFGASLEFGRLVQEAGHSSRLRNVSRRVSGLFGQSHNIDTMPNFVIVPERVQSVFSTLSRDVNIEPKNAGLKLEDGKIVVIAEKYGHSLDIEAVALSTQQILATLEGGAVEIATREISPEHKTSEFEFVVSVLGAFRTRYSGYDGCPRLHNVRLAAERINNHTIFPGEVFSAGEHIAANLPNSGYKPAVVLVRGEPVEDVGGGVCQVVSTLYNAVLAAELTIVQRHNHSAPVSYVEKGFDATVAGDYFDLKFENNTEHPILVVSQMKNGELYITIHGFESRPPERSIRFSAYRTEIMQPAAYREIVDATVPRGQRQVILESQMGYSVELRKHIYIDGQEVEVVKINTSVYKPLQGVIAIGAR